CIARKKGLDSVEHEIFRGITKRPVELFFLRSRGSNAGFMFQQTGRFDCCCHKSPIHVNRADGTTLSSVRACGDGCLRLIARLCAMITVEANSVHAGETAVTASFRVRMSNFYSRVAAQTKQVGGPSASRR